MTVNLIPDQSEPTKLLVEYTLFNQRYHQPFDSQKALNKFIQKNFNVRIVRQKRVPAKDVVEMLKTWKETL